MHADQRVIGLIVGFGMIAGLLGLLTLERLLGRVAPMRLLTLAALLAFAGVVGLLSIHVLWFTPIALFITSFGAICLYPIVEAEAYKCLPGHSGTVRAIISLGKPIDVLLPGVVGFIAGQFGLIAALGFLGSAPLLFLLIAPRNRGS